jgi:hypothetical protein
MRFLIAVIRYEALTSLFFYHIITDGATQKSA